MRQIRILSAMLLTVCLSAFQGWAYTLDNLGEAGGWDNVNKSDTVTTVWDTSDYTADVGPEVVHAALANAFGTWDGVETATNLNFAVLEDAGGNYDVFDGPNDGPPWFDGYYNLDPDASWNYANIVVGGWLPEEYFLNLGSSDILAVTWTGKLRGGLGPRKPTWHAEIFFNDRWNWTDNPSGPDDFDIETVALHELGHALGLGHGEADDGVDSIMDPFYFGVQRELFQDDIDGLTALYGDSGGGKGKSGGGGPDGNGPPGRNKFASDVADWDLTNVTRVDDLPGSSPSAVNVVPEPSSWLLAAVALLLWLGRGWRRRSA